MANEPRSPITLFVESLGQQPAMLRRHLSVTLGAPGLARVGAPGRIVIYPATGETKAASSNPDAIGDSVEDLTAEIWADGIDAAIDMLHALFQSMNSHGEGGNATPGYWWEIGPRMWNTEQDTSPQGVALRQSITLRYAAPSLAYDIGRMGTAWPAGTISSTPITVTRTAP